MRVALILALAGALGAWAQEAKKAASPAPLEVLTRKAAGARYIQRVYQVKHVDTDELRNLAYTTPSGEGQTPIVRSSQGLRAITVYGTPDEVNSIMENLKALDVPQPAAAAAPRSFELTMYILVGSYQDVPGQPVPDSLKSVTTELQRVFGLSQFKLLEAGVLNGSPGDSTRRNWRGAAGPLGRYEVQFGRVLVDTTDGSPLVRLFDFRFALNGQNSGVNFETNLILRQGQQVVVGKANLDGSDKSIVLVLSANVLK